MSRRKRRRRRRRRRRGWRGFIGILLLLLIRFVTFHSQLGSDFTSYSCRPERNIFNQIFIKLNFEDILKIRDKIHFCNICVFGWSFSVFKLQHLKALFLLLRKQSCVCEQFLFQALQQSFQITKERTTDGRFWLG